MLIFRLLLLLISFHSLAADFEMKSASALLLLNCIEGECVNGYGKKQATNYPISFEGYWKGRSAPLEGSYEVNYRSDQFTNVYKQGFLTKGVSFYSDFLTSELDYFTGNYDIIDDVYSGKLRAVPANGTYYMSVGAQLKGRFFAFPVPIQGVFKDVTKLSFKQREQLTATKLIFMGQVKFQKQSEFGVYSATFGVSGKLSFIPSDRGVLEKVKNDYIKDVKRRETARREKIRNEKIRREKEHQQNLAKQRQKAEKSLPWGKIFAFAAGAVAISNADSIDAIQKLDIMEAYTKDVMGNTTSNMNNIQKKYTQNYQFNNVYNEFDANQKKYEKEYTKQIISSKKYNIKMPDGSVKAFNTQSQLDTYISQYKENITNQPARRETAQVSSALDIGVVRTRKDNNQYKGKDVTQTTPKDIVAYGAYCYEPERFKKLPTMSLFRNREKSFEGNDLKEFKYGSTSYEELNDFWVSKGLDNSLAFMRKNLRMPAVKVCQCSQMEPVLSKTLKKSGCSLHEKPQCKEEMTGIADGSSNSRNLKPDARIFAWYSCK